CCLSYEHEQYLDMKTEMPRKGAWVQTPDGPGEVATVNLIKGTVVVELSGGGMQAEYRPDVLSEAGERVADLARSRAEEGITPGPRREAGRREPPPRREPRHTGERRLLRDELDNPDMLDALSLLEENADEELRPPEPRPNRPQERHHPRPERRPITPTAADDTALPDPEPSAQQPGRGGEHPRRRRRRGRIPGQE
ncbi:MAG TPA: hypothetical protein PKC19_09525, partial [Roseiflexaceae bacterium]|nr:hypothetical protein [Roseiflexaceae bacterium]